MFCFFVCLFVCLFLEKRCRDVTHKYDKFFTLNCFSSFHVVLVMNRFSWKFSNIKATKKNKKPCFTGATDPNFPFWQNIIVVVVVLIFPKSCKISCFLTKIYKFWLKIFKVKLFSQNFFCKNVRFFFPKVLCF